MEIFPYKKLPQFVQIPSIPVFTYILHSITVRNLCNSLPSVGDLGSVYCCYGLCCIVQMLLCTYGDTSAGWIPRRGTARSKDTCVILMDIVKQLSINSYQFIS